MTLVSFGWGDVVQLLHGLWVTFEVCGAAAILGSVFGFILGLAKISPIRLIRWISSAYVNVIRGVPLLVIIFFMYFGVPLFFPDAGLGPFATAVMALTVFAAAYIAEIVRGSIEAVPRGQFEAADSLGMGYLVKFRYIIGPQAMRIIVPPGISFLIGLVKDSSLVTVIGLIDVTGAGNIVGNRTAEPVRTWLVVAALYFIVCYGISMVGAAYERRMGLRRGAVRDRRPARRQAPLNLDLELRRTP